MRPKQTGGALIVAALAAALNLQACSVHKTPGHSNGIPAPGQFVKISADTDRGVTKTDITIGAVVFRQDSFSQFGLATLGGKPVQSLIQPFVDDLNQHGGIGGRHVRVAVSQFSPLVPAEAQTACVSQADDKKVFLSLAEIAIDDAQERCLASRQTPVLTSNSSSLADLKADNGWVHQISMSKDRVFKNWVDWLISSGKAKPTSRIGLLHADTPEDNALTDTVFLPYLKQRGLNVVAQAAFSGTTIDTVSSEATNSALKFKSAGVDLVLPDLDFLRFLAFYTIAQNSRVKTGYSVSDLGQLSLNETTNFYPSSFNGTPGVTEYTTGIGLPLKTPDGPAFADCLRVYQAHGQQLSTDPTNRLADELQLAQFCEDFRLIAHVAALAGPHLNRASFVKAFNKVTNWSDGVALTAPISYGPDKFDGPNEFADIRWQANCGAGDVSCYVQVGPYRKGRW